MITSKDATPVGVFIVSYSKTKDDLNHQIEMMNKLTKAWEMRAARGECSWVCGDCCVSFVEGMPNACVHGHQSCTDIIESYKIAATKEH